MIARILAVILSAVAGGAVVALPGVTEAIRNAVGTLFSQRTADKTLSAEGAARATEKEPVQERTPGKGKAKEGAQGAPGDEQGDANKVRLTPEQIKLISLKTAVVERASIVLDLSLNGEVTANQDRTVQILPRTSGILREILKNLGDRVRANEPVAVIESRELAEAEAVYLAAQSKAALAQRQFEREDSLFKKKITSEQDYLTAKQAAEGAAIESRAAEQKLTLLGLDPKTAKARPPGASVPIRVSVVAPFDGTLIEKRVAVGDQVNDQTPLFRIANLDEVWVIASVFEKDLGRVSIGLTATVTLRAYPDQKFEGKITWISDVLDEKTRTLMVRVELDNHDRLLKPGSFARVSLKTVAKENGVAVPPSAIQRQKSEKIVFVDAGDGLYKRREVKVGARSAEAVEVTDGLVPGETVVTSGSFILKSELEKSGFADND